LTSPQNRSGGVVVVVGVIVGVGVGPPVVLTPNSNTEYPRVARMVPQSGHFDRCPKR
jgi:hypothetical protein